MKAIVLVFIPPRDVRLLPEEALGVRNLDTGQGNMSWQSAKADLSKTSSSDEVTPPFWTWFVENPRHCGA